jgi:AraC-like DNA-binding protein
MTTPAPRNAEHTVPVSLAAQLVGFVERWHIPADELLEGSGLAEATLQDPLRRLPATTMNALLERARLLTGEPGLGYYLALQKRVSTYGYLGFAAASASSVREALELAVKYAPVFSTALSVELRTDGRHAYLKVGENADLGAARDIVLISMMLGLQTIAGTLTGQRQSGSADVAIPEPNYNARFVHLVPNWRWGQPANRVIIDAAVLDAPVVTADPVSLQLARTLCERALDELGYDAGLVPRVNRALVREQGGFRSLEDVAELLHLSERTLKRRLAAQGFTFSTLVERERKEQALLLLRSARLSIEEIAERLDYSNASTFVRAFRRWTGTTPAAHRRARGGKPRSLSSR